MGTESKEIEITPETVTARTEFAEQWAEDLGISVSGGFVSRASWETFVKRLLLASLLEVNS